MNIIDEKSIFTAMLQGGPFSVGEDPPFAHPFSKEAKEWAGKIKNNPLLKTKYRAVRNQIFDFLNISTFDEILPLVHSN